MPGLQRQTGVETRLPDVQEAQSRPAGEADRASLV